MPWPTAGAASIEVVGVGSLGRSGPQIPAPIGSVAKVMTAYLILKDHPLAAGDPGPTLTVTAADVAAYQADVAANHSNAKVALGERLSERAALEALLIPSADNVARMLAAWDAGTVDGFVAKMNVTAARLGLSHTKYADPAGLDEATVSTPLDQIALAELAMVEPAFAGIVAMKHVTLPVAGRVGNYNSLLGTHGVIGIKTGSTSAAGGCLVFAARRVVGGHTYTIIGAVIGQGQSGPFVDVLPKVMAASRKLIVAAEATLRTYPVVQRGQNVADVRVPYGSPSSIVAGSDLRVVGWPGLKYQLVSRITLPRQADRGATVGTLQVSGHGGTTRIPAQVAAPIKPPTLFHRIIRR